MIDPILITGLPRSGTSMIAGLLAECGVWTGETVGPSPDNPRGFFENEKIREHVVKAMLHGVDADPLGVDPLPGPEDLIAPQIPGSAARYAERQGCEPDQRWLYKDAKLTLMWRAWLTAYPKAKWIVVRRTPAEVIRSCLTTPFMAQHSTDPQFWGKWHDEYVTRLQALSKTVETYQIWPSRIMGGDWNDFSKLCDWLGVDFDRAACEKFVLPGAWHESVNGNKPFYTGIANNVPSPIVTANIRYSLKRARKRKIPLFEPSSSPAPYPGVCLIGGGPSIAGEIETIREMAARGYAICALNNTHRWLGECGIKPTVAVCLDARASNADFFKPAIPDCLYLLASRCAPSVWAACAKGHRYMYHYNDGPAVLKPFDGFNGAPIIGGGTTVGIVALGLALGMGFKELHLFGYDSCVADDGTHHAYAQPLNDGAPVEPFTWGGKTYMATRWMAKQAQEWQEWTKLFGHGIKQIVHGDGLIADLAQMLEKGNAANV